MRLTELLRLWRWREELSIREAAKIIGISPSTMSRIERGKPMTDKHLALVLRWLLHH